MNQNWNKYFAKGKYLSDMDSKRDLLAKILKLVVVVLAGISTFIATLVYGFPLAESTGIVGFFAFLVLSFLDYANDREVALAIYRSLKVIAILFTIVAVIGGLLSLFSLGGVAAAHPNPKLHAAVSRHVFQIKASFIGVLIAFLLSATYAYWKFKATRFAEGRIGLIKDLTIQINSILAQATPLEVRRTRPFSFAFLPFWERSNSALGSGFSESRE